MKMVSTLRTILQHHVPDAFIDRPADETGSSGNYPTIPLWDPDNTPETIAHKDVIDFSASENDCSDAVSKASPYFEFASEADIDNDAALGSQLGEHVRRAALAKGVDGLAWYISFHIRGPQWGIYLPISSIVGVAREIFADSGLDNFQRMRLAAHVLLQHELFHFSVDYMTLFGELATGRPCWKPARGLRKALGYYGREEKLANAHMLRRINAVPSDLKACGRSAKINSFVVTQPAGYCDAKKAFGANAFRADCEKLCYEYAQLAEGGLPPETLGPVFFELLRTHNRLDWRACPIHIVKDESRFSLPEFYASLFVSVSSLEETPNFLKDLAKCDALIRKAWDKTKRKIGATVATGGLDFKLWARHGKDSEFSVRVNKSFRAHLLFSHDTGSWRALAIGDHSHMGHG